MGKNQEADAAICPTVSGAFELLGRKWVGLIVHVLDDGEKRFCELEKAVPAMSSRMLAARMKELEEAGIVIRTVYTGSPVRVTYRLSGKGADLQPIMRGIEKWAWKWQNAG